MTHLTAAQAAALADLGRCLRDVPVVLIGANALASHVGLTWRATADIDLVVALEVPDVASRLGAIPGWRADARAEHRWVAASGARLDVVAAAPSHIAAGAVAWPRTGRVMRLTGMRLAFERAVETRLGPEATVRVPPLEVLVLLKIVAYVDSPGDRGRDLGDLLHVLDGWLAPHATERFSDAVTGQSYETAGAYLLGRRLGPHLNATERSRITEFLRMLRDERDPHATEGRMLRLGPRHLREAPADVHALWRAFEDGLRP